MTVHLPIITSAQVMTLRGLRVACASSGHLAEESACGRMVGLIPRLAYLTVTNAFAALRLLPLSDRDKDVEIRVPRTLLGVAM